jgi:cell division transport system ATP-binding protein
MIQMSHVSKTYDNRIYALSDVSFEVPAGEFAFLTGPGGSGKTTLFRILFCAERPTKGEVIVNGFHITRSGFKKVHLMRRTIGIIFQDVKLLRDRTVWENVAFALEVTGHGPDGIKTKALAILNQVGLRDRERDSVLTLSAGERQRVAIARALVNDPPLLLADEPTGNLDAQMTADVMRILDDLHQKGTTILFATHNMELIRRYPRRVIQIPGERRGEEGSTHELGAQG